MFWGQGCRVSGVGLQCWCLGFRVSDFVGVSG